MFDRLLLEAGRDFTGLTLGGRPSYAKTDEVHEAADLLGADKHYIFSGTRYSPSYLASWKDGNARAEVLHRLVRAYIEKIQVRGASDPKYSIRIDSNHGFAWVNGACLEYNYRDSSDGELLVISVGKHKEYASNQAAFNPGRQTTPSQSIPIMHRMRACIPCTGSGWVTNLDGNGGTRRDQCTRCNGSGQVSDD